MACITVSHLSYSSRLLSAWLVTTFTVERFIGVFYPLRRSLIISVSHARRVIIAETVACLALASFTPFTIGIVPSRHPDSTGDDCDVLPEMDHIYVAFNVGFVIIGSIVAPILVIVTLNTAIFRRVRRRASQRNDFEGNSSEGQSPPTGPSTHHHTLCLHNHHHHHHHHHQHDPHLHQQTGGSRQRDYNVTVLLLVVSTTFVVLNVPYCISWFALFVHHVNLDPATSSCAARRLFNSLLAAKYVATVPYCLNYGVNFALYSVCARAFREQLVRVLLSVAPICRRFSRPPAHNQLDLVHIGHPHPAAITPRAARLRHVAGQHELCDVRRHLEDEQVRCHHSLP